MKSWIYKMLLQKKGFIFLNTKWDFYRIDVDQEHIYTLDYP